MTTNITPREALEKIAKLKIKSSAGSGGGDINYMYLFKKERERFNKAKDIATQALAPQECDVKECAIELKYAPRKCEYFCMGDCCLPDTNRSCGTDKDNCEYYNFYTQLLQLKAENKNLKAEANIFRINHNLTLLEVKQLTQKLEKVREYLNAIVNGTHFTEDLSGHLIELAQQALKELE